jgi:hypothetical protein
VSSHALGSDADRVLIVGCGIAVGWGTTSHDEALPGNLARALNDLTERGADVDVVSDPELSVVATRNRIDGHKLWRYDVIILTLGMADALRLAPVRDFAREYADLVDYIGRVASPSTRLVVVTPGPVGTVSPYVGPKAVKADARAAEYTAALRALATERPEIRVVTPTAEPTDYAGTAQELADAIIDDLNRSRTESIGAVRGPSGQTESQREAERQASVDATGIVDTPEEDRFDRIVTMARKLYGTSGAAFAIVDHDRVWHKSKSEGVPTEVGKSQSFCSTTILLRGAHVVPDMLVGAAPSDTSAADDVGVRFYAGYPVESSSGEQIGALCIFDEQPRVLDEFDGTMLRQLALLIQAELNVEALA